MRPEILYLVHRVPYPPNRGDRIRSFRLLEFLAQRGNVHLATLADEPVSADTVTALRQRCRRLEIQPLGRSRWLHGAVSMARGGSATEGLFWNRRLNSVLRNWSEDAKFTAAVVFCSSMVQYLSIPNLQDVPAIVDLVDVDSQKWFDYAASARGPKRLLYRLEGGRLRQLERRTCDRGEAIMLVSEAEAELFRCICPNDHTHGVMNGVDLDYFQPLPGEGISGRCVFIGALDYRANIDGICWFCRDVWPSIRMRCPSATLCIVGRNPVSDVRKLHGINGVAVHGSVPDVRPFLADASLAVVPLRIARGIQNKILEAMASRRAVAASAEAVRGLQAQDGEHLVVPADTKDWASRVVHLLNDATACRRLASNGRRFVEENHSWELYYASIGKLLPSAGAKTFGPNDCDINRVGYPQSMSALEGCHVKARSVNF